MSNLDFELIKKTAEKYGEEMNAFLREVIRIPWEQAKRLFVLTDISIQ